MLRKCRIVLRYSFLSFVLCNEAGRNSSIFVLFPSLNSWLFRISYFAGNLQNGTTYSHSELEAISMQRSNNGGSMKWMSQPSLCYLLTNSILYTHGEKALTLLFPFQFNDTKHLGQSNGFFFLLFSDGRKKRFPNFNTPFPFGNILLLAQLFE